jgi:hypothetical protein
MSQPIARNGVFLQHQTKPTTSGGAALPPAVVNTLAKYGLSVPTKDKWPVKLLDGYLARKNIGFEDRLLVKDMLRQINGIE